MSDIKRISQKEVIERLNANDELKRLWKEFRRARRYLPKWKDLDDLEKIDFSNQVGLLERFAGGCMRSRHKAKGRLRGRGFPR